MSKSYRGARASLASMHGKASVIAPAMEKHLGLTIATPAGIDTDSLGTFTGETPRHGAMREVAIRKARLGMRASGLKIGIASEGSFGPHPVVPFLHAGMELMVLVDDARGLIISETLIADRTNHGEAVVGDASDLDAFLTGAAFPSHAMVVRPNRTDSPWWKLHPELSRLSKGITTIEDLMVAIRQAASVSEDGRARVQTDMRAHMNPTRMQTISELADRLARRIASECPKCATPGFGTVAPLPGIPCADCGTESIVPGGELWKCLTCDHEHEERKRPTCTFVSPGECPRCNP